MGYETVFGGTNIYPADVTYLALALTADVDLDWPMESAAPPYPMARIIDVIANGPHIIRLPKANEGSVGAIVLFNLLTASSSQCFVVDYDGVAVATLGVGKQWEIYLTDNDDPAGAWSTFQLGASTATVQPSALAGFGLTVTGATLSQSVPVTTFTATPRTALPSDRASALVWTGPGTATLNLPGVSTVGNNFFLSARNAGGGMLNLDPLGTEVIDGAATVALAPGEGVVMVTDGLVWYTLGRGQAAIFAFDYTAISLAAAGATYTLTGSELNRIAYKFFGALTTNVTVIVPSTFQQYWVDNATTNAFTLSLNTSTGVAVSVPQGARGIYYCDGTNVVNASTGGIALPISASQGGTGQSAYAVGDMLVASGPSTLAKLSAVPVGNALISGGAGAIPLWGKIDLATMVVGTLPPANGGTGAGAFAPGSVPFGTVAGPLVEDNANFNWDNTNKSLRIGTAVDNNGIDINYSGSLTGVTGPSLDFNEVDGSAAFVPGGRIKSVCVNATAGSSTMDLSFWTRSAGVFAERMRLSGAGVLTVNGAAVLTSASSGAFLSSAQNVMVNDAGGQARFFFAASGPTYHISPTGHNFRINGSGGPDPVTIDTAGNLSVTGAATINGNVASGGFSTGGGISCANISVAGTVTTNAVVASGNINALAGTVTAINLTATGQASGASVVSGGGGVDLSANNTPLQFTDASATKPKLVCQNDNNFVFYGTGSAGALRPLWSVGMRSDVSTFGFNTGITVNGDVAAAANINALAGGITAINMHATGQINADGAIIANGNVAAFSDAKLKTNLKIIPNALDGVCSLTGYTYERVDQVDGRRHTGLIAQDVQSVLPEAVGEHEGTLTLAYGNMVGLLVEAIKELRAEVDSLKARLP